jgi:hypothetical protein
LQIDDANTHFEEMNVIDPFLCKSLAKEHHANSSLAYFANYFRENSFIFVDNDKHEG